MKEVNSLCNLTKMTQCYQSAATIQCFENTDPISLSFEASWPESLFVSKWNARIHHVGRATEVCLRVRARSAAFWKQWLKKQKWILLKCVYVMAALTVLNWIDIENVFTDDAFSSLTKHPFNFLVFKTRRKELLLKMLEYISEINQTLCFHTKIHLFILNY